MLHGVNARLDRPCRRLAAVGMSAYLFAGRMRLIDHRFDLFLRHLRSYSSGKVRGGSAADKNFYKIDPRLELTAGCLSHLRLSVGLLSHVPHVAAGTHYAGPRG